MRRLRHVLLLAVPLLLRAEPPPAAPRVERLPDDRIRLGLVTVDPRERTATLPAVVNQTSGVIEYALVHETGKTHESLLRTDAGALDLHTAALLLGVEPAGPAAVTNAGPPAVTSTAHLDVTWTNAAGPVTAALRELLELRPDEARRTSLPFTTTNWLYTGSLRTAEGFAAHFEGSLIALIRDPVALLNNPGPDAADDDAHFPRAAALPPPGTPVTLGLHFPAAPPPAVP